MTHNEKNADIGEWFKNEDYEITQYTQNGCRIVVKIELRYVAS